MSIRPFSLSFCACLLFAGISAAAPKQNAPALNPKDVFLGNYRWLHLRYPKAETRGVVLFGPKKVLQVGQPVLLHITNLKEPVAATIGEHGVMAHLHSFTDIPCGFIAIDGNENVELPEFFIVTPVKRQIRGEWIREVPYAAVDEIDEKVKKPLRQFVMQKLREPATPNDKDYSRTDADHIGVSEQYAFREFYLPDNRRIIIAALKIFDLQNTQDDYRLYETPYHRHEAFGYILSTSNEIEQTFWLGGLSWAPKGRNEFRSVSPEQFLRQLVRGVDDIEPDGKPEFILEREGPAGGRIEIFRLVNGDLVSLGQAIDDPY